jgi:glyoxylase-like metal-dependent hydrolase (beta-lactamase superfamily II)
MMITEGIYQLKIPMTRNPLGKTYSYLLLGSKTLIDTGVPTEEAYNGLEKELRKFELRPQDIRRVLITHLHNDHVGLVNILSDYGSEIWASEAAENREKEFSKQWDSIYELVREETKIFGGEEYLNFVDNYKFALRRRYERLPIDRKIKDGETINLEDINLKAIWTPGHSPEHMVYYNEEKKLLFCGDHVLPKITSHISLHSYESRDPLHEYLESLRKVEELDVSTVLPGHEWVFNNLSERVEELRNHHKKRLNEIKDTLKEGEKTVYHIGRKIHWDSRPWSEMDFWTKRMAAAETYAHLIFLRNKDEILEKEKQGILYYNFT